MEQRPEPPAGEPDPACAPVERVGGALDHAHGLQIVHELSHRLLRYSHPGGEVDQPGSLEVQVREQGGVRTRQSRPAGARQPVERGLVEQARQAKQLLEQRGALPSLEQDQLLRAEAVPIEGMPRLQETVLFHRPSATLWLTDVAFHIRTSEHLPTRLLLRVNDALGRFGPSRISRWMVADPRALRRTVDRLLALRPARLLLAHGDPVEADATRVLAEGFAHLPAC